jgi:hypothetical protein
MKELHQPYSEVQKIPLPMAIELIKYHQKLVEEQNKAMKKKNGRRK